MHFPALVLLALLLPHSPASAQQQWQPASGDCASFLLSGNGGTSASLDGPPDVAQYMVPRGMAYDAVSTFLILSETSGNRVRRISI